MSGPTKDKWYQCCSHASLGKVRHEIRGLLKSKLQKLLKIYQNLTFCKFNSNVAQWECFCSHYKQCWCLYLLQLSKFGLDKTQIQIFLAKTSTIFSKNWILIFCCTTSLGMLFMDFFFSFFCTKGSGRYGSDKSSVYTGTDGRTDGRTDGQTDIHGGKNNMCLPQGRHIIYTYIEC